MIEQFVELTGADAATAKTMLEASKGDMEQALALHFDAGDGAAGAAAEEDVPMADEAAASSSAPALPTETVASSVGNILSNARQEAGSEPAANSFAGKGRALGSASAEADTAPAAPEADAAEPEPTADRTNAKKIRVIFWADGFTVEDVTAEEEAAKAAEKAPPAPRRTGLASLSSEKARGGGGPSMPKLPELRPYEENAEFMKDLQQSVPPREFRELDLSTGVPRPRPVDIMLGDMRPQAYPAEFVRRQKAIVAAGIGRNTGAEAHVRRWPESKSHCLLSNCSLHYLLHHSRPWRSPRRPRYWEYSPPLIPLSRSASPAVARKTKQPLPTCTRPELT